jgi:hypothetical protein
MNLGTGPCGTAARRAAWRLYAAYGSSGSDSSARRFVAVHTAVAGQLPRSRSTASVPVCALSAACQGVRGGAAYRGVVVAGQRAPARDRGEKVRAAERARRGRARLQERDAGLVRAGAGVRARRRGGGGGGGRGRDARCESAEQDEEEAEMHARGGGTRR